MKKGLSLAEILIATALAGLLGLLVAGAFKTDTQYRKVIQSDSDMQGFEIAKRKAIIQDRNAPPSLDKDGFPPKAYLPHSKDYVFCRIDPCSLSCLSALDWKLVNLGVVPYPPYENSAELDENDGNRYTKSGKLCKKKPFTQGKGIQQYDRDCVIQVWGYWRFNRGMGTIEKRIDIRHSDLKLSRRIVDIEDPFFNSPVRNVQSQCQNGEP